MGILMWQEEKQHMIWMVRGETSISLLRFEPHCPSPRSLRKVHQTTDLIAVPWHESHSRSSAQSCFSLRTHISHKVDSAQSKLTFRPNRWCKKTTTNFLREVPQLVNIDCQYSFHKQNPPLLFSTSSYSFLYPAVNSTLHSQTGETLLIRFPMANHVDVVTANWNWDQGALGNNWENNPQRTQRWIVRSSFQTGVTCGPNEFLLV